MTRIGNCPPTYLRYPSEHRYVGGWNTLDNWPDFSRVITRIIEAISWLINLMPFAIALIAATFFKRSREDEASDETTPADVPSSVYASDKKKRSGQQALDFQGSLFDDADESRDSERTSSFDNHREKTVFGFDESEWGSTFDEKRNDEPQLR